MKIMPGKFTFIDDRFNKRFTAARLLINFISIVVFNHLKIEESDIKFLTATGGQRCLIIPGKLHPR